MFSEQGNAYINHELGKFAVQRENLARAINDNQKDEVSRITGMMRQLLVNIRSAVREHMPDDTKQ
ncbi:TPA: hypothetical protein DCZ36_03505 [Candidatus Gracilibacteria bacterium]|nr:hypothetical protein [Candidatus Gracilibacteria bacterium]